MPLNLTEHDIRHSFCPKPAGQPVFSSLTAHKRHFQTDADSGLIFLSKCRCISCGNIRQFITKHMAVFLNAHLLLDISVSSIGGE